MMGHGERTKATQTEEEARAIEAKAELEKKKAVILWESCDHICAKEKEAVDFERQPTEEGDGEARARRCTGHAELVRAWLQQGNPTSFDQRKNEKMGAGAVVPRSGWGGRREGS